MHTNKQARKHKTHTHTPISEPHYHYESLIWNSFCCCILFYFYRSKQMCENVCVFIYVNHMYVCACVCMCIRIHMSIQLYKYTNLPVCLCIGIHMSIQLCTYTSLSVMRNPELETPALKLVLFRGSCLIY